MLEFLTMIFQKCDFVQDYTLDWLLNLFQHKKSFSDMFDAGEVAIELLDASESQNLFEGERKFYSVMTTYSVHQLKDVLETYLKVKLFRTKSSIFFRYLVLVKKGSILQ